MWYNRDINVTLREAAIFQESELIVLIIAAFSVVVVNSILTKASSSLVPRPIVLGFSLLVASYIFTVAEGVAFHGFFNILEHISYLLAGLSFAAGCRIMSMEKGEQ